MQIKINQFPVSRFFFSDTRSAWIWLIVRIYVGWQWLEAGWEKITSTMWVGGNAGGALNGFLKGALSKTAGQHPCMESSWILWLRSISFL